MLTGAKGSNLPPDSGVLPAEIIDCICRAPSPSRFESQVSLEYLEPEHDDHERSKG
jgi:hypothetical protein